MNIMRGMYIIFKKIKFLILYTTLILSTTNNINKVITLRLIIINIKTIDSLTLIGQYLIVEVINSYPIKINAKINAKYI